MNGGEQSFWLLDKDGRWAQKHLVQENLPQQLQCPEHVHLQGHNLGNTSLPSVGTCADGTG
jgi:hypothetical protein